MKLIFSTILIWTTAAKVAIADQGNQRSDLPLLYQFASQNGAKSNNNIKPAFSFNNNFESTPTPLNLEVSNRLDDGPIQNSLTSPLSHSQSPKLGVPFWPKGSPLPFNNGNKLSNRDSHIGNRKSRHDGDLGKMLEGRVNTAPKFVKNNDNLDPSKPHLKGKIIHSTGKVEDITKQLKEEASLHQPFQKSSSGFSLTGHSKANSQNRKSRPIKLYGRSSQKQSQDSVEKEESQRSIYFNADKLSEKASASKKKLWSNTEHPARKRNVIKKSKNSSGNKASIKELTDMMKGTYEQDKRQNLHDRPRKWNQGLSARINEYRKNLLMKHETEHQEGHNSDMVHGHIMQITRRPSTRGGNRDNSPIYLPRISKQTDHEVASRRSKLVQQLTALMKKNRDERRARLFGVDIDENEV